MAWLRSGEVVVGYHRSLKEAAGAHTLFLLRDGSLERLPLEVDPRCDGMTLEGEQYNVTDWSSDDELPDGRLQLRRRCRSNDEATIDFGYDLHSGTLESLATYSRLGLRPISWDPELNKAIAAQSSSICAAVTWISRDGLASIDLAMGRKGVRWNLKDYWEHLDADDCGQFGRADKPDWSPDGKVIAFWGSDPTDHSGFSRLDDPWDLYFLNPSDLRLSRRLENLYEPNSTSWSHDGKWLAFNARTARGETGVFLYERSTKRLIRVLQEDLRSLRWSADDKAIVGTIERHIPLGGPYNDFDVMSDVFELDLTSVVE